MKCVERVRVMKGYIGFVMKINEIGRVYSWIIIFYILEGIYLIKIFLSKKCVNILYVDWMLVGYSKIWMMKENIFIFCLCYMYIYYLEFIGIINLNCVKCF